MGEVGGGGTGWGRVRTGGPHLFTSQEQFNDGAFISEKRSLVLVSSNVFHFLLL